MARHQEDVRLAAERETITKEGYDKETLADIVREELLEMYVECVVERKDRELREEQRREEEQEAAKREEQRREEEMAMRNGSERRDIDRRN